VPAGERPDQRPQRGQVASPCRHFATIGVTVPTKPAKSTCILDDGNIGRSNDAQQLSSLLVEQQSRLNSSGV
jgi:hypothetical protein